MSANDQAAIAILSQVALLADGAFLGVALAYVSVRCILRFTSNSSSLRKLKLAPSASVSDLRALLLSDSSEDGSSSSSDQGSLSREKLVIVRGSVESKSSFDGSWTSLKPTVLVSSESGESGVILQRTQTCIYNEWRGFFGWASDLRTIFIRSVKEKETTSRRTIPFVLVDRVRWLQSKSDCVIVDLEGSKHRLPLTTVYHHLQPINASPYTFLQALFGHEYPVGILDEEKILPIGKDIHAVGICSLRNGNLEIKSCKDLPFFLSDMNKDQMVDYLTFRTKVLFWSGAIIGPLSIAILGYAIVRNWNRWKNWREQRRIRRQAPSLVNENEDILESVSDEDGTEEIPDGELCVICLLRRRRSAFVPCGHLVCCHRCAISVQAGQREVAPNCPVCRQAISNSVRIYSS